MKINKYLYGYKIYINYGYGYECYELTRQDMKNQVKCYKENAGHVIKSIKVTRGREINPDYINNYVHVAGYSYPI